MLDSEALAKRFNESFPAGGPLTDSQIARECGGITKQAVGGWRKTGRIAKKHLATLARLSGKPLFWWVGDDGQGLGLGGFSAKLSARLALVEKCNTYSLTLIQSIIEIDQSGQMTESLARAVGSVLSLANTTKAPSSLAASTPDTSVALSGAARDQLAAAVIADGARDLSAEAKAKATAEAELTRTGILPSMEKRKAAVTKRNPAGNDRTLHSPASAIDREIDAMVPPVKK